MIIDKYPSGYLPRDGYDLFTMEEWLEPSTQSACIHGEDGVGYWVIRYLKTEIPVSEPAPKGATAVVWYSK